MRRALTIQNVYAKKAEHYKFDGIWLKLLGLIEKGGLWMIWGREKNGKTWVALLLANYISQFEKTLYISGEEGLGKNFIASMKRAKISATNKKLQFLPFISLKEIREKLDSRYPPMVVFIDNLTSYRKELRGDALDKLALDYPDTLFVILAHEEKGEPYLAIGKLLSRLAAVRFYVEGLMCEVNGRCPGGRVIIDENESQLIFGQNVLNEAI